MSQIQKQSSTMVAAQRSSLLKVGVLISAAYVLCASKVTNEAETEVEALSFKMRLRKRYTEDQRQEGLYHLAQHYKVRVFAAQNHGFFILSDAPGDYIHPAGAGTDAQSRSKIELKGDVNYSEIYGRDKVNPGLFFDGSSTSCVPRKTKVFRTSTAEMGRNPSNDYPVREFNDGGVSTTKVHVLMNASPSWYQLRHHDMIEFGRVQKRNLGDNYSKNECFIKLITKVGVLQSDGQSYIWYDVAPVAPAPPAPSPTPAPAQSPTPPAGQAPTPPMPTVDEQHAFLNLARSGQLDLLQQNIEMSRYIDTFNEWINYSHGRWSYLHQACRLNNAEIVQWLLKHGAITNVVNSAGQTPADVTTSEEIKALLAEREKQYEKVTFPVPEDWKKGDPPCVLTTPQGVKVYVRFPEDTHASEGLYCNVPANFKESDLSPILKAQKDDVPPPAPVPAPVNAPAAPPAPAKAPLPAPAAAAAAPTAMWYCKIAGEFKPYDTQINAEIEQAYHQRQPTVTVTINGNGDQYTIDFNQMKQINKQSGYARGIKRLETYSNTYGTVNHPTELHTYMRRTANIWDTNYPYSFKINNGYRVKVHNESTTPDADGVKWAKVEMLYGNGQPRGKVGFINRAYLTFE